MKTLLAIRHAKSDWDNPKLSDHDRPLNKRGNQNAPIMGQHLVTLGIRPDVILSSTANRAISTARIVAEQLGYFEPIIESSDWYLASSKTLLKAIQAIDERAETALIFGHNPGMHEFSDQLADDASPSIDQFPTLAVAHFQFDLPYWGNVEWGTGKLVGHYFPKGLK